MLGENICYSSDKGLMCRIHKVLKKLNSKRINNSKNKWTNELDRQLPKE
jgi:hypothetical protein